MPSHSGYDYRETDELTVEELHDQGRQAVLEDAEIADAFEHRYRIGKQCHENMEGDDRVYRLGYMKGIIDAQQDALGLVQHSQTVVLAAVQAMQQPKEQEQKPRSMRGTEL